MKTSIDFDSWWEKEAHQSTRKVAVRRAWDAALKYAEEAQLKHGITVVACPWCNPDGVAARYILCEKHEAERKAIV